MNTTGLAFVRGMGLAVYGGLVTGLFCILAALITMFSGESVGAGIYLGSASLAFGLISNALIRK